MRIFVAIALLSGVIGAQSQGMPEVLASVKVRTLAEPGARYERVRAGVPLARSDAVKATDALRLVSTNGEIVPVRMRVLSRWGGRPDDGSLPIKWLSLTFAVNAQLAHGSLRLVRGTPVEGKLRIDKEGDRYTVTTAGLTIVLVNGAHDLLTSVRDAKGKNLGGPAGRVLFTNVEGKAEDATPWVLLLEDEDSVAATFLATCRVLDLDIEWRLRFVDGVRGWTNDLRVVNRGPYGHMGGPSAHRYFRRLGISLPRLPGAKAAILAGQRVATGEKPLWLSQIQRIHRERKLNPESFPFQIWSGNEFVGSGRRAPGTLVLGDGATSMGLAVERFWENAPKSMSIFRDSVILDLFPEGGSGPHYRGQYGEPGKGSADPLSLKAYRFEGARAKTQRFHLVFTNGDVDEIEEDLARRALHPLHALPPLGAFHRTGALGHPIPAPRNDDPAAARFERMMQILVSDGAADDQPSLGRIGYPAFVERGGTYGRQVFRGWFNFGDIPWADGYCSLHYDWPYVVLWQYLRTGDPRFFELGRDMMRHRLDIDQDHDTRSKSRQRGGQFYEKGHWHGNYYHATPSHTWLPGPFLYYLLTGDETALDAVTLTRDFLLRSEPEKWSGDWGVRIPGWTADNLLECWWVLGDQLALDTAQQTLANFERIETERFGKKGYVINRRMRPPSLQSWMHAIFFNATARHAALTGSKRFHPLMHRMLDFFERRLIVMNPAPRVWRHIDPRGEYRKDLSVHLLWPMASSLAWGAKVFDDETLRLRARALFEEAVFHHQGKTPSPIAFRMLNYPGAESKILSNIGLWGGVALMSISPSRKR